MPTPQPSILVVDDDDRLLSLLRRYLTDNGFVVTTVADAHRARRRLEHLAFDLVVLDIMLPGEDGLSFLDWLRQGTEVPVLMLTARGDSADRIDGLERGADDYLSKPFEPRELLLRVNSILRRATQPARQADLREVAIGPFVFDLEREELRRDETPVHLTSAEARLMRVLAESPGTVLGRDDLAQRTGAAGGARTVDVQVTRLRRKIEADARTPRHLQTVRGQGYVLRPD